VRMAYYKLGVLFAFAWLATFATDEETRPADAAPQDTTEAAPADPPGRLRRPLALALDPDQKFLYVANRCGSLSVIDLTHRCLLGETDIGRRLSSLVHVQGKQYLATDEEAHELLWLTIDAAAAEVTARIPVSPHPVSVLLDSPRKVLYVASLWTRRITRLDLPPDGPPQVRDHLDLEIAPRCLMLTPDGRSLIVGDSFTGKLAIVDPESLSLTSVRSFPGHNIRGLSTSVNGKMLVIAHQMLNDLAHTVRNDVHWGLLMSNDLRWLQLASVLDESQELYSGSHMHPLGEPSNATADPSGLAVAANGTVVVALGGVNEIAMGKESDFSFFRVAVGKRPTAVTTTADSQWALVANTFGDSISLVNLAARVEEAEISLGPQPPLSLVDQGEVLFYSGKLSHDGWMSCHSCHTDGHSNGGLNDNFSDGSFGAPKRVLSLLGCADTEPFAWNGQQPSLPSQLQNSVEHTMQGNKPLSESHAQALVAYLTSLPTPPPVDQLRGTLDEQAVERGAAIFEREGCSRCHAPPRYTSAQAYDVGLEDERGNRHFNPPSLRGLSQRGPYLHDNRAARLHDVLRLGHPAGKGLPDDDLAHLVAFLRSL
jgi:cytochrome c peroxidase